MLVHHDLDAVPGLLKTGLEVDDVGVTLVEQTRLGRTAKVADFPRSRKAFWPSTKTMRLLDSHRALCSFSDAVWGINHPTWTKSES